MKTNDRLYGFIITGATDIPECAGTLYMLEHEKTGARLAFLDREDNNKSFAIAFPTLPDDDTGVFHIIEHSVLCGSEKFPVKEPFVELLKGSLNTFLNALTYEDKTVYPVSSRCDKDFYNLTEVYLDAVFCPRMKTDASIFAQEGWHLERDESGALGFNGVVYNEMKGAYSSPDELGFSALTSLLFEGTPYGKDSGGKPSAIPTLTYEGFKAAHDKYYHPSNAYVFLDGSVNLDEILPLIASYFDRYERGYSVSDFCTNLRVGEREKKLTFAPTDDDDGRGKLYLGYIFSSYDKPLEQLATSLICDVLAGSNEAPLKKAILDKGLAEDVVVSTNKAKLQTLVIEMHGIDENNVEKIKAVVKETIEKLCSEGISKERLSATLGRTEFKLREADFGSFPRGVANALAAYSTWIYGGEVADALAYEDAVAELWKLIPTDYFEKLLLEATLNAPTRATVVLVPDENAEAEREMEEKALVDSLVSSLTEEELSALLERTEKMKAWQSSEDSEEALATLPMLKLEDISPVADKVRTKDYEKSGARILSHDIKTGGILYTTLYLNCADLKKEELPLLALLSSVLQNLPTESYTAEELKNKVKANLGSFSINAAPSARVDGSGDASVYLTLTASALPSKAEYIPSLAEEVLLRSDFSATDAIRRVVLQLRSIADEMVSSSPDSLARGRAEAAISRSGAISDALGGVEFVRYIKPLAQDFEEKGEKLALALSALARRIFSTSRLTVSVAGDSGEAIAEDIISRFPDGERIARFSSVEINPRENEAIITPAAISHTSKMLIAPEARELLGALRVVRSILSYEFLWNAVRVRGGAYGTGFLTRRTGLVGFYSHRDPSPRTTLNVYLECAAFLRRLAKEKTDLTKFIIGAIGEYDILYTPRSLAAQATADILTGWSAERERELRAAMISISAEDLIKVAELLESYEDESVTCIAASRSTVESIEGKFSPIIL